MRFLTRLLRHTYLPSDFAFVRPLCVLQESVAVMTFVAPLDLFHLHDFESDSN
jgi:hypothetical protein